MTARANPFAANADLVKPLIDFGMTVQSGLDPTIADLVKLRASQINGCAGCLYFHTREFLARGESEERIFMLDAWRESPLYTDAERAALAWTEALTRLGPDGASDAVYEGLKAHFSEADQIKITLVVGAINAFNRFNVGFRVRPPGAAPRKAAA